MYNNILFDLDGTLTDPGIGITNSVAYALEKFDIKVNDRAELFKFIGPPLMDSFSCFCGFDRADCEKAVVYYREYFGEKGIFENEVFDGVVELLKTLKINGKKLIIATSKPQIYAERILHHFKLFEYFDFVAGATLDYTRVKKADVIGFALESCGITDKTSCLMVGDREQDIFGAKAHNISSVGVLFGYGSLDELKNAGATYIAETLGDILRFV